MLEVTTYIMVKKRILVILVVFLIVINFFMNIQVGIVAKAEKLYVGGIGEGNYSSIQSAINNTSIDDIVYVYNGKYFENIMINKSISLIGENKENTILYGTGSNNVITIRATSVNITGFTIQNGLISGILIESSKDCKIFRNIIDNNIIGIKLISSKNFIITNNTISNNSEVGINITNTHTNSNVSKYNTIYLNNFIDNKNNVFDEGKKNNWSYENQGNFYDDYNGIDKNNDGIGDNSYSIAGGKNKDKYPLMMPYNGKIRLKEFYVDDESLYTMLIIGMIIVIIFLIPIAYVWYRKTRHLK